MSISMLPEAIAIFHFPNKKKVHTIQGRARQLFSNESVEKGFVFCSFDGNERYVIEKDDNVSVQLQLPTKPLQTTTSKNDFEKSVKNIQKAINDNRFSKVVAAKNFTTTTPENFDVLAFFFNVLKRYDEAFVCLVYIEGIVCWLCATPELLLKSDKTSIKTYSLAGTIKGETLFSPKEVEEQQIVTDAIIAALSQFPELEKVKHKQKTLQNGSLTHLLTTIKAGKKGKISWDLLAGSLHPTPAVGSFPKENGIAFIQKNETFNRSFYSGYLGKVKNDKAKIYVNLRCMEITKEQLIFYAGCGITAASDVEKEWQETEHKLDILRSLFVARNK